MRNDFVWMYEIFFFNGNFYFGKMMQRSECCMEIKDLVFKYKEYVRELRRNFHQYPELSFEETETTQRIADELDKMGISYKINPEKNTGLVAVIHGSRPGRTVALRADIDALPVTETNSFDFRSKNEGKMHACGHDGHMAVLLGAARMLMDMKEEICGTVYLVFQPAEEVGQGALYMMRFGDWYEKTDNIFGGHVWIDVPAGKVSAEAGSRMAAADQFVIRVHGRSGHGSQPNQAIDAVVAASAIVMNLQTIVSRHYNPLESVALTVGSFHSGNRFNIIAGEAVLEGTTRYFKKEIGKDLKDTMDRIVTETARAYGATAELQYDFMVPPTINDDDSAEIARQAVKEVLGESALTHMRKTTGGEDFAFYLEKKPGCFIFPGIYNEDPAIDATHSHHSHNFNMDDSVLSGASGVYAQYAIDWLKAHQK